MGVSCQDCGSTINFCPNCGKPMGVKKAEPKKEAAPAKKEEPKKEATPAKKEEPKKEAAPAKKEEPKKEAAPAKKDDSKNSSDDNLWLFLITILTILMGLVILSMFQDDLTFLDLPNENDSSHIRDLYKDLR